VGPFAGGTNAGGSIVDSVVGNAATAADACSTMLRAGCASKLPETGPASDGAEMWQVTAEAHLLWAAADVLAQENWGPLLYQENQG
jgi:hypothetical protein